MKKACISFCLLAIIVFVAIGFVDIKKPKTEYLRIHVRADSNLKEDQDVKYLVKDEVVKFLTPYLTTCDTKEKAKDVLICQKQNIQNVANAVLKSNGKNYTCTAEIKTEEFPTRVYQDLTLKQGYYDALILNLGSGKGDNWWCVVYPPLCFVGDGVGYVYKSKLLAIINSFYKNE